MITFKELLDGHIISEVPIAHQHNGEILLERINKIRSAWGKAMIVTSGYRSIQDHLRIYSQLAAKRGVDFDPKKVPMKSNHLTMSAVDISDPDRKLYDWCVANEKLLEEVGLWCEIKDDQKRVHFQIIPPRSGKRFFHP